MDVQCLEDLLYRTVRHALCDMVCEYYAFTAPLCHVPPELITEAATADESQKQDDIASSFTKGPDSITFIIINRF